MQFVEIKDLDYQIQVCLIVVGLRLCRRVIFQEQNWTTQVLRYYFGGVQSCSWRVTFMQSLALAHLEVSIDSEDLDELVQMCLIRGWS